MTFGFEDNVSLLICLLDLYELYGSAQGSSFLNRRMK